MLEKSAKNFLFLLLFLAHPINAIERQSVMSHAHYSNLTLGGDIFSNALPAIAVLGGYYEYRHQGAGVGKLFDPLLTVATMSAVTIKLKLFFRNTELGIRPNGFHDSFPSGHTSSAFCGALLIHKMFGINYGVPAYALAAMTAYSRIEGKYHHKRDLLAGGLVALGVHLLVDRFLHSYQLSHNDIFITPAYGQGLRVDWSF